jgi:pseudouridylate synthase / pseudouridine kinase
LQSGIAIFNPIPAEQAIPKEELEIVIEEAVHECDRLGVKGKDVTPFLLKRVVEQTKGKSLQANIHLIQNNARVSAQIALSLASLESKPSFQPPPSDAPPLAAKIPPLTDPVDIMVIGSMAVDLTCNLPTTTLAHFPLQTSLLSKMHTSAGGVAHNVALAASYASSSPVRLVTALGTDPEGAWLREYAQVVGLDVAFIAGGSGTARYVALHDKDGELVSAAADMGIITEFRDEDIQREIERGNPKFLAFDGNISPRTINTIFKTVGPDTMGAFPLPVLAIV